MAREAVRYSDSLTLRCQPEVSALIDRAALHKGCKPSEYVRQGVLAALRADGFDPSQDVAPRDAGSLYDLVDGQRRYALIEGGQVVTMSYHATDPAADGRDWRPVTHRDSEPFDIVKHWRLQPEPTIEADGVVVTYPVVLKAAEMA